MENKISLSLWVYSILWMIVALIVVFTAFNALKMFSESNSFKPDFSFEYWEEYNNPLCEFNNNDVVYQEMCAYLIDQVLTKQNNGGTTHG